MQSQGMKLLCTAVLLLAVTATAFPEPDVTELKINVEHKPKDCSRTAKVGDTIKVHYSGYLTDGKKFDSSFDRNDPIGFKLGQGQVIQGWEKGLEGACVGEKRKLHIPPALGYGDRGAGGIIPGGATLIFDTELVSISN